MFLSLVSQTSSLLFTPLKIVPSAPTTIGITVTHMLHDFFSSLTRSKYLSFRFFFNFHCGPPGQQNLLDDKFLFFFRAN